LGWYIGWYGRVGATIAEEGERERKTKKRKKRKKRRRQMKEQEKKTRVRDTKPVDIISRSENSQAK
jgi:hypothetical protein